MYSCGIGRIIFRTVCLSLFLRESDIFRREIIQGFYLGELLRKAKTLKSGRPLAQMVSLSTWETWRPAEERPRHIILKHNHPLTSEPHFPFLLRFIFHSFVLQRSPLDGPLIAYGVYFSSTFHRVSPGSTERSKSPLAVWNNVFLDLEIESLFTELDR